MAVPASFCGASQPNCVAPAQDLALATEVLPEATGVGRAGPSRRRGGRSPRPRRRGRDNHAGGAGPEEGDVPGAGADQRLADPQAAAHMALGVGEPMRGAVGPEQIGVGQGARIASIGLDLPCSGRVHRGEVRVGDDDLMPEPLEAAGDPFTVGRGLDEDPRPGPRAKHRREALGLGADALLDQFASLGQDADLTFPLVDVDANMVHGWPLLSAALTACDSCGAVYATTSSGRPAAFIPSTRSRASPTTPHRGAARGRRSANLDSPARRHDSAVHDANR